MNIIVTSRNASLSTKSRNIKNIINETDLRSSDKPPKLKKWDIVTRKFGPRMPQILFF